jgi:hypothetical protein
VAEPPPGRATPPTVAVVPWLPQDSPFAKGSCSLRSSVAGVPCRDVTCQFATSGSQVTGAAATRKGRRATTAAPCDGRATATRNPAVTAASGSFTGIAPTAPGAKRTRPCGVVFDPSPEVSVRSTSYAIPALLTSVTGVASPPGVSRTVPASAKSTGNASADAGVGVVTSSDATAARTRTPRYAVPPRVPSIPIVTTAYPVGGRLAD